MSPKKDKEKEKFQHSGIDETSAIEDILKSEKVTVEKIENIVLEIESVFKGKIDEFKESYHTYQQSGRYVTTTKLRQIKKRDFACFINLQTDVLVIERIKGSDGVNLHTNNYEYPISLTKSIEIKTSPLISMKKKTVIHLCIANVSSLEIASHMRDLVNSVFLRNILKYKDERAVMEKPLMQIIIGGLIFGIALYFGLMQVFKKAIVYMIGQFEIVPPAD